MGPEMRLSVLRRLQMNVFGHDDFGQKNVIVPPSHEKASLYQNRLCQESPPQKRFGASYGSPPD